MYKKVTLSFSALWCGTGLWLCLTFAACSDDAAQPNTLIPGSFESIAIAGVEQQVVYLPEGNKLYVEVTSIEDSRCPSDVFCVWAGVAHVRFSISGVGQPVDLNISDGSSPEGLSHIFLFKGQRYELTLTDVTPYPTSKNAETARKAHFSVRPI